MRCVAHRPYSKLIDVRCFPHFIDLFALLTRLLYSKRRLGITKLYERLVSCRVESQTEIQRKGGCSGAIAGNGSGFSGMYCCIVYRRALKWLTYEAKLWHGPRFGGRVWVCTRFRMLAPTETESAT